MSATHTYRHTQRGPWWLLLLGIAAACLVLSWISRNQTVLVWVVSSVGVLMLLFSAAFRELTVEDEGDQLSVAFGPLRLFRRTVSYSHITEIEQDQTILLEGWGIHLSPRGGWVWNIWGRDCVRIHFGDSTLRIGTDDPEGLVSFLRSKTS